MTRRPFTDQVPKDYRRLVRAAVDAGWVISKGRQGHMKITAPDGRCVPVPSSSTAPGTFRGIVKTLRDYGLDV